MNMNAIKSYVLARLQESSTWRGLIVFATVAVGYTVNPEQLNSWVAAAVAISAAMKVTIADKPSEPTPKV
jgi:hypothetical protein